ncbi:MAG: riboflavin kinase [Rikenellaceae bacterium]|nr:riboflavin kinase [Rikenellaceae bacterium]
MAGEIIKGVVIAGRKLGRELGFPTANVATSAALDAHNGVYAVRVHAAGRCYEGMANLGRRPSVSAADDASDERLLEVNIFGFEGELYGCLIEVELCHFIRPEQRFDTLADLRAAIAADRAAVKEYFALRERH